MLPANQGLRAENPVAAQIHLRLVVQHQFPALQRAAQPALQHQALVHA